MQKDMHFRLKKLDSFGSSFFCVWSHNLGRFRCCWPTSSGHGP